MKQFCKTRHQLKVAPRTMPVTNIMSGWNCRVLFWVRNWSWCTGPSDANREALIRKNVHLALLLLVNSAPHKVSKTLTAWRWRPIQNRSTILFRKLYDDTGQWTVNIVTSHNISVQRCAQWSEVRESRIYQISLIRLSSSTIVAGGIIAFISQLVYRYNLIPSPQNRCKTSQYCLDIFST